MITADHMALHEEQESGLHHRYAVTVQNAMVFLSYPCKTKSAEETQKKSQ